MKVFVISLERAVDRRKYMTKQLERLKLDYEIVDAIDGSVFTAEYLKKVCHPDTLAGLRWWLTDGMIACALSHREAYKRIVEANLRHAFILEDDAVLPDNISEILLQVGQKMSAKEVINFNYTSKTACALSVVGKRIVGNYQILYPMNPHQPICTASYLIDIEAARHLIDMIFPIKVAPDSWGYFYESGGIDSYACVYPIPCSVANFQSTLDYMPYRSIRSKIFRFIEKNRIPVLYQLKSLYRKYRRTKEMKTFYLTNEASPIYLRNILK
jgi:glycosyl transferase family 25